VAYNEKLYGIRAQTLNQEGGAMIDLVELKKLCAEYDRENGTYPESEYEGAEIYKFAEDRAAQAEVRPNTVQQAQPATCLWYGKCGQMRVNKGCLGEDCSLFKSGTQQA
jgi:hypothetical protein